MLSDIPSKIVYPKYSRLSISGTASVPKLLSCLAWILAYESLPYSKATSLVKSSRFTKFPAYQEVTEL